MSSAEGFSQLVGNKFSESALKQSDQSVHALAGVGVVVNGVARLILRSASIVFVLVSEVLFSDYRDGKTYGTNEHTLLCLKKNSFKIVKPCIVMRDQAQCILREHRRY